MESHATQRAAAGAPEESRQTDTQSLEQLLAGTRSLYADTAGQFKGLVELAMMELELAIASAQWWLWTLVMFGVCSVMTGTLLITAIVLAIAGDALSPAAVVAVLGVCCALAASVLFLFLKSLSRKMAFKTLRAHLAQQQGNDDANPGT
ncbi:MAG: hypothetical protein KDI17_11835 [Halioglobus sp.]|nr:hypothetical protein [Halioglobus sp.]